MGRPLKRHQQRELFPKHGGKRKNAGRPPKGPRSSQPHKKRPALKKSEPVHVTVRVVDELAELRQRDAYKAIRTAMWKVFDREEFHVVHVSIERSHIHLLVEAADRMALARGMQALQISAARHINHAFSKGLDQRRRGSVFGDRYHAEIIKNRRQARHALAYVLNNWRRHGEHRVKELRGFAIDPFSSAINFDGWREPMDVHWPPELRAVAGLEAAHLAALHRLADRTVDRPDRGAWTEAEEIGESVTRARPSMQERPYAPRMAYAGRWRGSMMRGSTYFGIALLSLDHGLSRTRVVDEGQGARCPARAGQGAPSGSGSRKSCHRSARHIRWAFRGHVLRPRARHHRARSRRCFGEDEDDIAQLDVKKYAYEAFGEWSQPHPDKACPDELEDLTRYMDLKASRSVAPSLSNVLRPEPPRGSEGRARRGLRWPRRPRRDFRRHSIVVSALRVGTRAGIGRDPTVESAVIAPPSPPPSPPSSPPSTALMLPSGPRESGFGDRSTTRSHAANAAAASSRTSRRLIYAPRNAHATHARAVRSDDAGRARRS